MTDNSLNRTGPQPPSRSGSVQLGVLHEEEEEEKGEGQERRVRMKTKRCRRGVEGKRVIRSCGLEGRGRRERDGGGRRRGVREIKGVGRKEGRYALEAERVRHEMR